MNLKYSAKTALKGLQTNRSRSVLTILGIVIGITAIMIVMSLGAGAQNLILGQIEGLGSRTIAIVPGRQPTGPSDSASVFLDSLKAADVQSLKQKNNVPEADMVMPVVFGPVRLGHESNTYQSTVFGAGSTEDDNAVSEVFDIYPSVGVMFLSSDVRGSSKVVVIGSKIREKLFGLDNPVGKKIKVNGQDFRVVGLLPKKGQVSFFNFDDMVIMPYTTAQNYVVGRKYFDRIIVTASSEDTIAATEKDITATLRNNHKITDPEKDDFFVQTQADLAATVSTITTALTLFLVAVAGISLMVGGIGIMNIMLVAVSERTREIGLRKALGATDKDISTQFLLESVMLTGIGGIIGIILGATISFLAAFAISTYAGIDWGFVFPVTAMFLGVGVSGFVGLIFGIYPARQAAKKSPIEALRYE